MRETKERGSALTEMAIALPLLVMLILGLFDGIILAKDYFTMTEIAREGVLAATTISKLPLSTTISNAPLTPNDMRPCFDATFSLYQPTPGNEVLCAERAIRWRLMKLGVSYGREISSAGFEIRLERDLARRSVTLKIEREMRGVSPFFKSTIIRSRAEGPYDLL